LNINFYVPSFRGCGVMIFFCNNTERVLTFTFQTKFEHFGQRKQAKDA